MWHWCSLMVLSRLLYWITIATIAGVHLSILYRILTKQYGYQSLMSQVTNIQTLLVYVKNLKCLSLIYSFDRFLGSFFSRNAQLTLETEGIVTKGRSPWIHKKCPLENLVLNRSRPCLVWHRVPSSQIQMSVSSHVPCSILHFKECFFPEMKREENVR